MSNSIMTTLMWAIAIAHVLTDRILWPFIQSAFTKLTTETNTAIAAPVLTAAVAAPPVKAPATKAPATPRPARRRRSSTKTAA